MEPFVRTSSGRAARQARYAPVRFVRSTASQPSGDCSSIVPPSPMPALQTRTSSRPKASFAAATGLLRVSRLTGVALDRQRTGLGGHRLERLPAPAGDADVVPVRAEAAGDRGADALSRLR